MSGDDQTMRQLLQGARRIAVLGASPKPHRDSHRIFQYLRSVGYDVVPVNPRAAAVAGVTAFADLESAGPVDLVNVFRDPSALPEIVEDVVRLSIRAMWTQYGVVHPEAEARARAAGVEVVSDRCIMVEHRRLI